MTSSSGDSSDFVQRLNAATDSSFEELDRRYRRRLCALVEKELGRRFASREDPEDAVQSALRSLFRGLHAHRFRIDHTGALWKLLEQLTRRKVLKHIEHHTAEKRDPGCENPGEEIAVTGREPTPEEAAAAADLIEQLAARLSSQNLDIFRLKLQGYERAEIAKEVKCTEQAVKYAMEGIRDQLSSLVAGESDRRV